jgi:hypothetical protein
MYSLKGIRERLYLPLLILKCGAIAFLLTGVAWWMISFVLDLSGLPP